MNIKIHFAYIVGILIAIIILLFSVNVGANEKFVGLFNFALTISSILLALVAIVYSFISNSTISKNLYGITDSANKISLVSDELEDTTNKLLTKMDEVPLLLKGMDKKVDDSIQIMKEIKTDKENVNLTSLNFGELPVESKESETNISWNNFLKSNSLSYLTFLFALSLSYKTKKPFDFESYIKNNHGDKDYLFGGKVIFNALGIIELTEKDNVWNVLSMNEYIFNNVREFTYELAKKLDADNQEKFKDIPYFKENSYTNEIKSLEDSYK